VDNVIHLIITPLNAVKGKLVRLRAGLFNGKEDSVYLLFILINVISYIQEKSDFIKLVPTVHLELINKNIRQCGCGVAHTVAHTTPVQEDLGLFLHPKPGQHFSGSSHLPSFRQ
jgi:hypothetical protein